MRQAVDNCVTFVPIIISIRCYTTELNNIRSRNQKTAHFKILGILGFSDFSTTDVAPIKCGVFIGNKRGYGEGLFRRWYQVCYSLCIR